MEDVAPVPAPDNRRIIGGSCPGIIDGTRWFSRWSSIIIRFGIFPVPVWLAVANAGTLNTGHACTLLSGEYFLRRGRAFCRLGVSLFSPQVLHESIFLDAWVLKCQNDRREPDYLKSLGVCGSRFQGSVVFHTAESIFITYFLEAVSHLYPLKRSIHNL